MSQFCVKCGHQLQPDGRCGNCGWTPMAGSAPPASVPPRIPRKKNTGWLRWLLLSLALLVLTAGIVLTLVGVIKTVRQAKEGNGNTANAGKTADETTEAYDAEKELEKIGRVTDKESAKKRSLLSESEALQEFEDRGFTENPITYCYNADGEFIGRQELESGGSARHPVYETYYETPDGVVFSITLEGDIFYASPLSWQDYWSVPHMISESEDYVHYDSAEHMFYEVDLDKDVLILKRIRKIDTETLDELTAWEVDEL